MRYFVTGATGFVGGRLVRRLVQAGHEVVAIVRDPGRARDLAQLRVDVRAGDVTERESLRGPMSGVDGVFHVAGWYKLDDADPAAGTRINVQGTRNVLEVMRDLGVPKGVYTSTLAVYSDTHGRAVDESYRYDGPHLTEYDRTKWVAHYAVAEPLIAAGLPLVIVQPGVVYGPGDHSMIHDTFVQYLRRRLLVIPRGTAFAWGYVDDVAQGHVLAMERGRVGESYNLCGPVHTLGEVLQSAQRITGIPAPRIQVSAPVLRAAVGPAGLVSRFLPLPSTYRPEALRSSAGVTYIASNAKARRELGWEPRPLEEGLPPTLRWEMAELGKQASF